MRLITLAVAGLLAHLHTANGLHCLAHDHCGDNAVCVTANSDNLPKCMCLLGYVGNGANCKLVKATDKANRLKSLAEQHRTGARSVTIEKSCNASTSLDGTPFDQLADGHSGHHGAHGSGGHPIPSTVYSATQLGDKRELNCSQVMCDFSDGPCSYSNDAHSHWALHAVDNGNTILYATGPAADSSNETLTSHYLLGQAFLLESPALLQFHYFESSETSTHVRLCDNELANTMFLADVRQRGWRNAQLLLNAGLHRLIFIAEQLSSDDLVALDNIRIHDARMNTDVCD